MVILPILQIFFQSFNYLTSCFLLMFVFGLLISIIGVKK